MDEATCNHLNSGKAWLEDTRRAWARGDGARPIPSGELEDGIDYMLQVSADRHARAFLLANVNAIGEMLFPSPPAGAPAPPPA